MPLVRALTLKPNAASGMFLCLLALDTYQTDLLQNEICQIGNNFNQLVRRANRLGTVPDNDMKRVRR